MAFDRLMGIIDPEFGKVEAEQAARHDRINRRLDELDKIVIGLVISLENAISSYKIYARGDDYIQGRVQHWEEAIIALDRWKTGNVRLRERAAGGEPEGDDPRHPAQRRPHQGASS